MKALLPFIKLYGRHWVLLTLGVVLAIIALLASISLLTLSGWFLAASSLAGFAGLYTFNYLLPAAGVRGAAIVRTAARYFERLVSHDATFRVLQYLRIFTFTKLLPLSPAGITQFRHGDLLNRFVADIDTLDHLYLRVISPLISAVVVITAVTFALSFLDSQLALTLGSIMLLTLLLLPPWFYQVGRPSGEAITRLRGHYRLQLINWLQGYAELKIYGSSRTWREQLDHTEQQWQQAQRRQANLQGLSQAVVLLISGVTVTLLLWMSAMSIGTFTKPGALIALVVFCALAAFEALAPIAGAFQHLGQVVTAAQRVKQIIDPPAAVTFDTQPMMAGDGGCAVIELCEVGFQYPAAPVPTINTLSLTIAAGEKIALLGHSGCGKSTLLQLLTRAWDTPIGTISLKGIPIKQWDEPALRANISVVSQRVHLFSQTLRDNLLLAAPECDDKALEAVLQQVGLEKLLIKEGLDAWMGEGGRQLSGGELRRLAIARALLHNGDLLLLDEPTEGLDAETERQMLELLWQTGHNKTLVMVTHRLQGIERFDRICVMDQGTILEQGHHQDLMAMKGRYWHFLNTLL